MINALKLRQNDLPAMVGIGIGLVVSGLVPRWIFAAQFAEEPYATTVLGQMILGIMPLVIAGYLFTDRLLYNRYIEQRQRGSRQGWLGVAFCLFYGLELVWLWYVVNRGEVLVFDRAIVLIFVAALFLDWRTSLMVGLFALLVRFGTLFFFDAGIEGAPLPTLTDPAGAFALLSERSWLWYEPGILALFTALLLGIASRAYYHQYHRQAYPIWVGFPCAILIEAVYLGTIYWSWDDMTGFIDLAVNYTIPDILGIGAPTLLLLLMMDAAVAEAERKRAQAAELALEKTKLLYLQSQINPHFLFNALSTIQGLTYDQPAKARELLAHLGDMYEVIARYRDHLIPLEQELEHVHSYLFIARARWPDRLKVEQSIADTVNRQQPVPALILQPLVENAVEHGLVPKAGGGVIEIGISETEATMQIAIRDDGVGMPAWTNGHLPATQSRGVGLQNVISRLQTLYGQAYTPQIQSRVGEGTVVTITIPKAHYATAPT